MTTTDSPERTSSPAIAAPKYEETDTSKQAAPADVPAASIASGGAHTEDHATIITEQDTSARARQEASTPDLPTRPQDAPAPPAERVSPEVESLKAMFPDFDPAIIQSVLESVNGDQERAADVLLGMSDPSYEPQHHDAPVHQSQSELDEQLARRLMLEEQQQQASWHPDQQYPFAPDQRRNPNVPYQPRSQQGPYSNQGQQWGSPPRTEAGGKDTMTEVQEQFSKFAETGKKTFSSLMTKVKAKMQEFDQTRNPSSSTPQTSWGTGTPGGVNQSDQSQYNQQPNALATGGNEYGWAQGYDATPQPQPQPQAQAQFVPAPTNAGQGGAVPSGATAASRAPAPDVPAERIPPRPPSAGPPPAGNVDPSKIGMLPKRSVSLLSDTPPQSNTQANTKAHRAGDEDELDYVENPFEDGRK